MKETKKIDINKMLIENVFECNFNGVTRCYNDGADFNTTVGGDNFLVIHCSKNIIDSDRDAMVKLLIKYGTCVNTVNKHGFTPLHYALENNNTECVKALVEAGADINFKNYKTGFTYLHEEAMNEHDGWLQHNNFDISTGNSRYLIDQGCDTEARVKTELDEKPLNAMEIATQRNNITTFANLYIYANQETQDGCFGYLMGNLVKKKMKKEGLRRLTAEEVRKKQIKSRKLNTQRVNKVYFRNVTLIGLCLRYFRRNKISRNDFNMLPRSLRKNLGNSILGKRKQEHQEDTRKTKKKKI